ncbi:MAG: chorismate mutase [Steroidobacteraceae bacterium]
MEGGVGDAPSREPDAAHAAKLDRLRAEVDRIDLALLRLVERRGRVVSEILAVKDGAGWPVRNEARERQLLSRLQSLYQGPYRWSDVRRLFDVLLQISIGLQVEARARREARDRSSRS